MVLVGECKGIETQLLSQKPIIDFDSQNCPKRE